MFVHICIYDSSYCVLLVSHTESHNVSWVFQALLYFLTVYWVSSHDTIWATFTENDTVHTWEMCLYGLSWMQYIVICKPLRISTAENLAFNFTWSLEHVSGCWAKKYSIRFKKNWLITRMEMHFMFDMYWVTEQHVNTLKWVIWVTDWKAMWSYTFLTY